MQLSEKFYIKSDSIQRVYLIQTVEKKRQVLLDGASNYLGRIESRDEKVIKIKLMVLMQSIEITLKISDITFLK